MNYTEMMAYLNRQRNHAQHALEDSIKNLHNAAQRYTMENAFNSCAEYINSYAARVDNARKRLAEVEAQIEALENLKL